MPAKSTKKRKRGADRATPALDRRSRPLTTAQALDLLRQRGTEAGHSQSVIAGLRSTFLDGVREAFRSDNGTRPSSQEVMDLEIQVHLPILHSLARAAGTRKGHKDPGDHARRAARAVELVSGERYDSTTASGGRLNRFLPLPSAWDPLVSALLGEGQTNARSHAVFLAQCCTLAGYDARAPADLPTDAELVAAATELLDGDVRKARQRVSSASVAYRRGRRILLSRAAAAATGGEDETAVLAAQAPVRDAYAYLPVRAGIGGAVHLGSEPLTYQILEARGLSNAEEMDPHDLLQALLPGIAGDYDAWVQETANGRSAARDTKENSLRTLLRLGGWLVRQADLTVQVPAPDNIQETRQALLRDLFEQLYLDDLYVITVEVDGITPGATGRHAERLGRRSASTVTRSLLAHLVDQEAWSSLDRSTVTGADVPTDNMAGPGGLPYITEAIKADCGRIWTMAEQVYAQDLLHAGPAGQARWGVVQAAWSALHRALDDRLLPAELKKNVKDKKLLISTITLPQLLCVAAPIRRREILDVRERWVIARQKAHAAGYDDPDSHPTVKGLAAEYFEMAVPHLMLTLPADDGLRKRQYTFGRPGRHFRIDLERDEHGMPVGVRGMQTYWTGAKGDPARLKNWKDTNGTIRERKWRDVRLGFVPATLLWDCLRHQRPRDLVRTGVLDSLEDYDLEADLRDSPWCLFVSPKAPAKTSRSRNRPARPRTDLSVHAGQELHRCARILRPELPSWDDIQGDPAWRSLWAMHITRLLIGSYWGGVRDDWQTAVYLTTDKEETLRGAYAEVADEVRERTHRQLTHWEHPQAYDRWMDAIYYERQVADPLMDPDLPLPPHLVDKVEGIRKQAARKERDRERERKRIARSIRIRAPRPGQQTPASPAT